MTAIDISKWQGTIDFAAVKSSGVQLVIAKMGGADSGLYTDSKYLTNRAGIRANGIRLGSYFFNGPASTPTACADYMFARIDYRPGDLVVIDVEGPGIAWSPGMVLAWTQRMLAHGVRVADLGVYMSASPERSQDWSAVAATGCFLWVASYGTNSGSPGTPPTPTHWSSWGLWQYTSNGSCPGVPGRVDTSLVSPAFAELSQRALVNTEGSIVQIISVAATDTFDIICDNGFHYPITHAQASALFIGGAFGGTSVVVTAQQRAAMLAVCDALYAGWVGKLPASAGGPVTVDAQVDVQPELVAALKDPTVLAALSAAIKIPTKIEATLS